MRLAFYSPLNPIATGISDYSEELLPLLAREFEIELVVDDYQPSNPALAAFQVRTRDEFKRRAPSYDLVLYHMGNSPGHAHIFETLQQIPGVVVMHDLVLHHLRAWQTVDRRNAQGYVEAMRADYGEAGAELARLEARGVANLNRFDYPLNGEVARAARALVVHSRHAADELQKVVPHTPIAVIPMGVPPIQGVDRASARTKLGLAQDAFIVAAFGEVHPHKRVTVALEAFAEFHLHFPNSLFLLIGRESPNYDVAAVARLLKLDDSVRRVGFAPRADYENYIGAADLCLNLRYPTAGETSAALLRLFAAGKAVIVTRTGSYAELPDSVCAKIEPDEYERDLLIAHLDLFATRPDYIAKLGNNARAFAAQCHTLEQSAAAYADFLHAVGEKRAESKSYLVEWKEDGGRRTKDERRKTEDGGRIPNSEYDRQNETADISSVLRPSSLVDALALHYAELGLDADDPILQSVARALVELGLTGENLA